MQEELDLRRYAVLIARYGRLILVMTVAATLLAALVSRFVLPRQYEATATVVVASTVYSFHLDPYTPVASPGVSARVLAGLAKNADLQQQVVKEMYSILPESLRSVEAMGRLWSVSSASDASIIRLKVTYGDPRLAADIANTWAAKCVEQMNQIQAAAGAGPLEEQVAQADQNLRAAEQALILFQQTNSTAVLSATMAAQVQALADYAAAETNIELAMQDAQRLKQQLQSPDATLRQGSQLALLLTELNALVAKGDSGPPVQVVLDVSSKATVSEQVEALDSLIAALRTEGQALAAARDEVSARILQSQGKLLGVQMEMDHLLRAKALAEEVYQALSRQAEEQRIAAQLSIRQVQLASRAVVPERPSSPNTLFNMAVGAVFGLAAAILSLVVAEYVLKPSQADGRG